MNTKAIIFDLDNTIYPVSSIGEKLFFTLFETIENDKRYVGDINAIKNEIMRRPFQVVAKEFEFNDDLTLKCLHHLSELTYQEKMEPFSDYSITKSLDCLKFLVTTGFTKLQFSKIDKLDIKPDFKELFVVDPNISTLTKKDVFREIMVKYNLGSDEIIVVGDDLNSEIKAGKELGIKTVLYDFLNQYKELENENVINNYAQLEQFI